MNKNWLKEGARDIIALGSIPFFLLVLMRVSLLNKPDYFSQFIIAGILLIISYYIFKPNLYAGLGLIVLTFTVLYYDQLRFTIFAIIAYLLLIFSLVYLKENKIKIFKGILLGAISVGLSYYLVHFII